MGTLGTSSPSHNFKIGPTEKFRKAQRVSERTVVAQQTMMRQHVIGEYEEYRGIVSPNTRNGLSFKLVDCHRQS